MSLCAKKLKSGFPTRTDKNRHVPSQKHVIDLKFWKRRGCTICVAKTRRLISCAVTAKLISDFVFTYADYLFSDAADHVDGDNRSISHRVTWFSYVIKLR